MVQIKFIKNTEVFKKGETVEVKEDAAKIMVGEGAAVYLEKLNKAIQEKEFKDDMEEQIAIQKGEKKDGKIITDEMLGKDNAKITLEGLHNKYKELLYIEDTDRIDIVLATVLSNQLEGIPIWLILVGPSGDMKSVQLNAIHDKNCHYLQKITSKTLVNGYKDKKEHPDLAPALKGKVVVIRDMASLLKLPPVEKGEVWGQLRDLYDGFAGTASGQGVDIKYEDIKITLLAGSTPAIDGQILVHQDLGTRELIFRTTGNENKKKVMERCMDNEESEKEISDALRFATTAFLRNREIKREFIDPKVIEKLKEIAIYVTYMRATAEIDSYSGELRNYVYPEEPTRIVKQMKRLYICLMSLADDYPSENAMRILWRVARSSAFPIRTNLFEFMLKQEIELTTSKIAEIMRIGKKTAKRELSILMGLRIVNCRQEETNYPDKFIEYWKCDPNHKFVKDQSRHQK